MSFAAMFEKETADLLREKRFGIWALIFLAFWTLFLVIFLAETSGVNAVARRDYPTGITSLMEVAYFFYSIAFVVLALFLLSDGVTKERESGMLPLVGAKPIRRSNVLSAKLATGGVIYVGTFLVSLLPAGVLALALGSPAIELIALMYVGPLLALFAFNMGFGLLVGVASTSSKVAIGSAAGIYLPLFLMTEGGPMELLYANYPGLRDIVAYTPFEVVHRATRVAIMGGQMPWAGLALVVAIGGAFTALAFWLFSRQEVAA